MKPWSKNLPADDSTLPIPACERSLNRHLYTCKKSVKSEALVLSASGGAAIETTDDPEYPYAMRGVFDITAKCEQDWCCRRFNGTVSDIIVYSSE